MSLLDVPNAPGAVSGQRGMADCIWAEQRAREENNMAEIRDGFISDDQSVDENAGHVKTVPDVRTRVQGTVQK
jgi:hypothetical protein